MTASNNLHPQLFGTDHLTAKRDYNPSTWHEKPDVVFHASLEQKMPGNKEVPMTEDDYGEYDYGEFGDGDTKAFVPEGSSGTGFHTGTLAAAVSRSSGRGPSFRGKPNTMHPLVMTGQHAIPPHPGPDIENDYDPEDYDEHQNPVSALHSDNDWHPAKRNVFTDDGANYSEAAENAIGSGHNVPYRNDAEDSGSISYRSPRENLHTWRESVAADLNAPSRHRAIAEQGYELHVKPGRHPTGPDHQQPPLDGPGVAGMGPHGLSGPSIYGPVFHEPHTELRKPR